MLKEPREASRTYACSMESWATPLTSISYFASTLISYLMFCPALGMVSSARIGPSKSRVHRAESAWVRLNNDGQPVHKLQRLLDSSALHQPAQLRGH